MAVAKVILVTLVVALFILGTALPRAGAELEKRSQEAEVIVHQVQVKLDKETGEDLKTKEVGEFVCKIIYKRGGNKTDLKKLNIKQEIKVYYKPNKNSAWPKAENYLTTLTHRDLVKYYKKSGENKYKITVSRKFLMDHKVKLTGGFKWVITIGALPPQEVILQPTIDM